MQFRDLEATDFDDIHRRIRGSIPDRVCRLMQDYAITNMFIPLTVFKSCVHFSGSILRANLSLRAILSAGEQVGEEFNHWGRGACKSAQAGFPEVDGKLVRKIVIAVELGL